MREQGKNMSYKKKWYLSTWIIALCFTLWFIYGVPLVLGIILLILQKHELKILIKQHNDNANILDEIGVERYVELTEKLEKMKNAFNSEKKILISEIDQLKENRDSEKERLLREVEDKKALLISDNVEVMWLVKNLKPDFKTIADFRKDNKQSLTNLFKQFSSICKCLLGDISVLLRDMVHEGLEWKKKSRKVFI